ncbi:SERTA domain-containing protein 3 [Cololabis saira]|uniref:SERTA domain-containing protein 3 n=1 Tax=Cololabis saira TaxID=129043 RepID=UPI002AD2A10F|nr:SERTA domain-containing protein 3 [Cololabis saira]XP_061576190.1 SERTA domain-containing protein 3 [Cololabis saira]
MIMKGQKRKLRSEDAEVLDRSSPIWETQRQFVFSVSLNKYQRSQELPEPSLRRSVLIANTLRQISLEACRESSIEMEVSPPSGGSPSSYQEADELDSISAEAHEATQHIPVMVDRSYTALPSCSTVYLNCLSDCAASCHFSDSNVECPSSAQDEDEDWGSMSTESDFSLSAAISSILTALDSTMDGSSQAAPRTPLRSLENLTGAPEGGVAWMKQGARDCGVSWEQPGEGKVREGRMEAMRSSYLGDVTVEDLFQDVDTSLLEKDMGVLALGANGAGHLAGDDLLRCLPPFSPSSLHPFSLSLSPSLRYLPSFSSFSPLYPSSPPSAPSHPSGQNQAREGFELDHLMEILVES